MIKGTAIEIAKHMVLMIKIIVREIPLKVFAANL
jgi:hypothetical protein